MKTWIIILLFCFATASVSTGSAENQGDASRGASNWADNCARCHNMRDPTEFEPKLWVPITWHMRVRAGLTGQETRDIVAFLQQASSKPVATDLVVPTSAGVEPAARLSGAEVYDSTCVACHGQSGQGMLPGVPDFNDPSGPLATKSAPELLTNMMTGYRSPGSPMAMPAKGGNSALTQEDLEAVLTYLIGRFN